MPSDISSALHTLKVHLSNITPTGPNGFEGLIGHSLGHITGCSYRLASSGAQFGLDGQAVDSQGKVVFEAKRYINSLNKDDIKSKLFDISTVNADTDIWILAATVSLGTQLSELCHEFASDHGFAVLILDWQELPLPQLAVAIAALGQEAIEKYFPTLDKTEKEKLGDALALISAHTVYEGCLSNLKQMLCVASLSYQMALRANIEYLHTAFANRRKAKLYFGQALCPNETTAVGVEPRSQLVAQIQEKLSQASSKVLFILGDEGVGKSWIIAQTWLGLIEKPIFLFCNPEMFLENLGLLDVELLLIKKLLEQTGERENSTNINRWQRRFSAWKQAASLQSKLVFWLDGINQQPSVLWERAINLLYDFTEALGIKLIITCRRHFYDTQFLPVHDYPVDKLMIPPWSRQERDEILANKGVDARELSSKVQNVLLNPRILGIALELFHGHDITCFEELSVGRLLFEHIRTTERDNSLIPSAKAFAKRLSEDATVILNRRQADREDDLLVFEADLISVADGRFYNPLEDEPQLYRLEEQGLTLALGFAIVSKLKAANRNKRDLDETILQIWDPVAALDDIADVLLAALTVAICEQGNNERIAIAIIRAFLRVQHFFGRIHKFSVFSGLARRAPEIFLQTAKEICISDEHWHNFVWLEEALLEACEEQVIWHKLRSEILDWFSYFSFSIEHRAFKHLRSSPADEAAAERQELKVALDKEIAALSEVEKQILNAATTVEFNPKNLVLLGLKLFVGKPLAPIVGILVNWRFLSCLNGSYGSPTSAFTHLVQFNAIDWSDARLALLMATSRLNSKLASKKGQWTVTYILNATGDTSDAYRAHLIKVKLVRSPNYIRHWRRLESICVVDPCDPDSKKPKDLDRATKAVNNIDVTEIKDSSGNTSALFSLKEILSATARFCTSDIVDKINQIFKQFTCRKKDELRWVGFFLRRHGALVDEEMARQFCQKWLSLQEELSNGNGEDWDYGLQVFLVVAFPFLTWQEQLRYLELACCNTDVSITLLKQVEDIPEEHWQRVFQNACEEKNQTTLYMCLNLVRYRGFHLPKSAVSLLASYYPFSSDRMNTAFLGVACCTNQLELIKAVVDSGFNANEIKNHANYQKEYGSAVLIQGAKLGLLSQDNALARAEPRFAIDGVHLESAEYKREILWSLEEALQGNSTEARLKSLDGEIKLEDFYLFQTISPGFITRWGGFIEQARDDTLRQFQRTVLLFSVYLREVDIALAEKILAKVQLIEPSMNYTFDKPTHRFKSYAYWYGAETAVLNELRLKQLTLTRNDDELAQEVLSGLLQGKGRLLFDQVNAMLQRPEPVHTARALMILGFSDVNSQAEQLLSRYSKEKGLIGQAYKAAIFAYDRNKWSRHWFKLMAEAQQAVDFWRYSVLFAKIVDDRYYHWYGEYGNHSEVFSKFKYTFIDSLRNRVKSWQDKRKKTLFGGEVPKEIFFGKV